jgi:hypothetical protein
MPVHVEGNRVMRTGVKRIRKREWYALGGFANPALFRRMQSGVWFYYKGA